MHVYKYKVAIHKAEPDERGFWAKVPDLPGCYATGDTLDELYQDIQDAIETYLEDLQQRGLPIPAGVPAAPVANADEPLVWEVAVA